MSWEVSRLQTLRDELTGHRTQDGLWVAVLAILCCRSSPVMVYGVEFASITLGIQHLRFPLDTNFHQSDKNKLLFREMMHDLS